jgi:hypothetical protein
MLMALSSKIDMNLSLSISLSMPGGGKCGGLSSAMNFMMCKNASAVYSPKTEQFSFFGKSYPNAQDALKGVQKEMGQRQPKINQLHKNLEQDFKMIQRRDTLIETLEAMQDNTTDPKILEKLQRSLDKLTQGLSQGIVGNVDSQGNVTIMPMQEMQSVLM